jgi:phosphinothricin acetyltransferase
MKDIKLRDVTVGDTEELLSIYSYYVEDTAISFEYETPTVEEFKERIENISKDFPYFCAEKDGKILGYAYASKFHPRKAYEHCAEVTIYLDKDAKKMGLGRLLYEELERRLKAKGFLNLYACIAVTDKPDEYLNNNSAEFHEHMGYKECGRFQKCGIKYNRWYDMIWMEKIIGEHK